MALARNYMIINVLQELGCTCKCTLIYVSG